jgi:hypothetical protein
MANKKMQQRLKPVRLRVKNNTGVPNLSGRYGIFFLLLLSYAFPSIVRGENSPSTSRNNANRLPEIIRDLSSHLQLDAHIEVQVDDKNDKMASSEPLTGPVHGYLISFDREFLQSLNDDELIAAVAHELGHIWIFSHHPYLQTEELANEIAMRVVDRATMKKVYAKLWAKTGTVGSFDELLGPDPTMATPKAAAVLP